MKQTKWMLVVIASFLFLFPAFYNGFPIVFSDTGTYISSGFSGTVPIDRPIFYGIFLRHTSLGSSLWLSLFVQSFIVANILYAMVQLLVANKKYEPYIFTVVVSLLTTFSAVPYFTSLAIPDIFTPMSLLLFCLILFSKPMSKIKWVLLYISYIFIIFTHLSNLATLSMLLVVLWVFYYFVKEKEILNRIRLIVLTSITLFCWVLLPFINSLFGFGFHSNKSSHVFLLAKMIDNGVLVNYLNTSANAQNLNIYKYKDSLPAVGGDFLWGANSVLYKTGGWAANKQEYDFIIHDILTNKQYCLPFIYQGVIETFVQLTFNNFGEEYLVKYDEQSPPYNQIKIRLSNDLFAYTHARQFANKQSYDYQHSSYIQNLLLIFSICLIILYIIKFGVTVTSVVSILVFAFVFLNAMITAVLSTISARYNSRATWLVLFIALVIILKLFFEYHSKKRTRANT